MHVLQSLHNQHKICIYVKVGSEITRLAVALEEVEAVWVEQMVVSLPLEQ